MDAQSKEYGSVGAISGIKNPIKAAHAVLRHARVSDPLGRIPPLYVLSVIHLHALLIVTISQDYWPAKEQLILQSIMELNPSLPKV